MKAEEYINKKKIEDHPGGHLVYMISVDDALKAVQMAREERNSHVRLSKKQRELMLDTIRRNYSEITCKDCIYYGDCETCLACIGQNSFYPNEAITERYGLMFFRMEHIINLKEDGQ